MSSMQRLSSFESSSKKKFGKNLNKIQKPPAPPIARDNGRSNSSSRNGLMLLSTAKTRSSSTGTTKGLLSSKRANSGSSSMLMETVNGTSQNSKEPDAWGTTVEQTNEMQSLESLQNDAKANSRLESLENYSEFFMQENYDEQNMDDYHNGDQSLTPEFNSHNGINPDQVSYMSRLARERAEKRRSEEEARMNEQRERAAQRLRELEERMGPKKPQTRMLYDPNEPRASATPRKLFDPNESRRNGISSHTTMYDPTEPIVETRPQTLYDPNEPRNDSVPARTLYDPSRSFSTMVGEIKEDNSRPKSESMDDAGDEMPSGPVIQLSSYEDRDRGERKTNNGPRMLYDPKSGAMVAVTPDKGKKGKQKGRKEPNGETPQNGRRKNKTKKEEMISKKESPKMKGKACRTRPDRLPRTCGALYLRDEHGKCYSADGQEGDQGYGCHSVPGGRMRNPIAYEKYLEQERQMNEEEQQQQQDEYEMEYTDYDDAAYLEPPSTPNEDFTIDYVKADEKIELLTGALDSPTLQATAKEWAPSQTALVAVEKATHGKLSTGSVSLGTDDGGKSITDDDDELDDDMDDPTSFIGLGFDPTENMDSVIQSPSIRGQAAKLEGLDLEALSLAPSAGATTGSSLFAFGSSSTWGNHKADGDSWAVTEAQDKAMGPSPFLSLNTWGSTALSGLGGDSGAVAD